MLRRLSFTPSDIAAPLPSTRSLGHVLLQVWNANSVTGVVGVFHLQGSSWDRVRRKFHVHDKAPRRLSTEVRPYDVDAFRPPSNGSAAAEAAVAASEQFAVYSRAGGVLSLLHGNEGVKVGRGLVGSMGAPPYWAAIDWATVGSV